MRLGLACLLAFTTACSSTEPNPGDALVQEDAANDAAGDGANDAAGDGANDAPIDSSIESGGDGGAVAPLWKSGTRIKARVLRASGGAQVLRGFRDTKLDVDCSFMQDKTGKLRCLPSGAFLAYTDAACTKAVGMGPKCATSKYTLSASYAMDGGCGTVPTSRNTVFALGAPTGDASALYYKTGTTCGMGAELPDSQIAPVTGEVDPSELVAVTETLEPRPNGLLARVLTTADGAMFVESLYEASSKQHCVLLEDDLGAPKSAICSPGLPGFADDSYKTFSDPACTKEVARVNLSCATPKIVQYATVSKECGGYSKIDLRKMGPRAAKTYGGSTCAEITKPDAWDFYELAGPADVSAYSRVESRVVGTGALHALVWTAAGQVVSSAREEMYLSSMQGCEPLKFPDGKTRCVPYQSGDRINPTDQPLFSDAGCTKRAARVGTSAKCPVAPPTKIMMMGGFGCGSSVTKTVSVGSAVSGKYWYRSSPTATDCFGVSITPDTAVYELGGETTAPDWPEITEALE